MSYKSKKQENVEHVAPSLVGWQLTIAAAETAMSNPSRETLTAFIANMVARENEFIPSEHQMKVVTAVAALACKAEIQWPDAIVRFLHAQLGKKALMRFIEGSNFEIQDCDCAGGIGYHVVNRHFEQMFKDMVRRNLLLLEMLLMSPPNGGDSN